MAHWKPTEDRLIVRKCIRDHVRTDKGDVLVALCDSSLDTTRWVEILAVGPKCKLFRKEDIGKLAYCRYENGPDLKRVPDTEADYFVRERADDDNLAYLFPITFANE
jgi:hypothetical protein